jgi:hypothetical protein
MLNDQRERTRTHRDEDDPRDDRDRRDDDEYAEEQRRRRERPPHYGNRIAIPGCGSISIRWPC